MWWYLISGSQATGLSLVINVGGKYKVTLSLILAEGFKTKIRNKLLPSTQIPSGFSSSSPLAQHLWTLMCMHMHTRAHTPPPKITSSVFCLLLFIFLCYPLFPYFYWLLPFFRNLAMYFSMKPVPFLLPKYQYFHDFLYHEVLENWGNYMYINICEAHG